MSINTSGRLLIMWKGLRGRIARRRLETVGLCESCGQVCDAACRAKARRDAVREQALSAGLLR